MSPRWLVRAVDLVNRKGKSVGVRLVRYTGKSPHAIHPKHLIDSPWHDWYAEHLGPDDVVIDVGLRQRRPHGGGRRPLPPHLGFDYDAGHLAVARRTARARSLANAPSSPGT